MPDFGWVLIVFVGLPLFLLLGVKMLIKKSRAKFSSDGSIAETFASDDDGTFVLSVPEHATGPLGIYVEYNVTGAGPKRRYGLVLRVDVERADFQQRGEYLIGSAVGLFREVPELQSLDASLVYNMGADVKRTLLLARVPAGDSLRVSGKVKRTIGETHSVLVYAKPLAS